jgi:hypothetical protein
VSLQVYVLRVIVCYLLAPRTQGYFLQQRSLLLSLSEQAICGKWICSDRR